ARWAMGLERSRGFSRWAHSGMLATVAEKERDRHMRPVFIGIAGGSGSGKTTVTRAIVSRVPEATVAVIEQDSYYKDQNWLPFEERLKINYDHPAAFDTPLLVSHLDQLAAGQPIEKPVYNY